MHPRCAYLFREVGEGGEEKDSDGEEEHEEPELLVAPLERVAQGLEPRRVSAARASTAYRDI